MNFSFPLLPIRTYAGGLFGGSGVEERKNAPPVYRFQGFLRNLRTPRREAKHGRRETGRGFGWFFGFGIGSIYICPYESPFNLIMGLIAAYG